MRYLLSLSGCLALIGVLAACGAGSAADSAEGIRVEAQQAVLVTGEPLGDEAEGQMEAGDTGTALCFVAEARTNTGAVGAAIKIKSGGLSGFAAVTDFLADPADRVMVFDVDDSELRAGLPPCRS